MTNNKTIVVFENQLVRRLWNENEEKWYFSVGDIVQVLTAQPDFQLARNYCCSIKLY